MEISQKLKDLIVDCTIGNVKFPGQFNQQYCVQNFFFSASEGGFVSFATLKNMLIAVNKQLSSLPEEDLFGDGEDAAIVKKRAELTLQKDTLTEVGKYIKALAKEKAQAEKKRKETQSRLNTLKKVREEVSYKELAGKGVSEVDKLIEELELELETA